jgi:hypothetical protein
MVTGPVTEVLRHQSAASTRPYITDTARGSARLASLAVTMSVATAGRPSAAGADGRDAISAAAPRKARWPPDEPLHAPARVNDLATRAVTWLTGALPDLRPPAAYRPAHLAGAGGLPEPGVWPHMRERDTSAGSVFELGGSVRPVTSSLGHTAPQPFL